MKAKFDSFIEERVIQYLSNLKLKVESPSYSYLERICHSHLNTFPFENISKLIYLAEGKALPSIEKFMVNYSVLNYGGTCFTLNTNLYRLLDGLGFNCYLVMLSGEHMAIIVEIDNVKYYVDCGAAAPFFKPVAFEENPLNETEFGSYMIIITLLDQAQDLYEYVRFSNGERSGNSWKFNVNEKQEIEDFNEIIRNSNQVGAPFMRILRCQIWQTKKNRSVSLVNNKLTIRHSDGSNETTILKSIQEIEEVIQEEFQLPKLPVKDVIKVLEELKIDIFTPVH